MNEKRVTKTVRCPVCGSAPGVPCQSDDGTMHLARIDAYNAAPQPEKPFDLDAVLDPTFTGGLSPVEYLNRLHEGTLGDRDANENFRPLPPEDTTDA